MVFLPLDYLQGILLGSKKNTILKLQTILSEIK